jgi:hypothetical protein
VNLNHPAVSARAGERCEYCRAPEQAFNFAFEVEHIVPPKQGGSDLEDNWALACRSCNVHKGSATVAADPLSGQVVRLFHPRMDQWAEHFRHDFGSGEINGLTDIGRATAARLRFNSPAQLSSRRLWHQHGLFPS